MCIFTTQNSDIRGKWSLLTILWAREQVGALFDIIKLFDSGKSAKHRVPSQNDQSKGQKKNLTGIKKELKEKLASRFRYAQQLTAKKLIRKTWLKISSERMCFEWGESYFTKSHSTINGNDNFYRDNKLFLFKLLLNLEEHLN